MKPSSTWSGKNPIPGPKPFGLAKPMDAMPTPAETAQAAVRISSVDAMPAACADDEPRSMVDISKHDTTHAADTPVAANVGAFAKPKAGPVIL